MEENLDNLESKMNDSNIFLEDENITKDLKVQHLLDEK